jgi:hypothetical protein
LLVLVGAGAPVCSTPMTKVSEEGQGSAGEGKRKKGPGITWRGRAWRRCSHAPATETAPSSRPACAQQRRTAFQSSRHRCRRPATEAARMSCFSHRRTKVICHRDRRDRQRPKCAAQALPAAWSGLWRATSLARRCFGGPVRAPRACVCNFARMQGEPHQQRSGGLRRCSSAGHMVANMQCLPSEQRLGCQKHRLTRCTRAC